MFTTPQSPRPNPPLAARRAPAQPRPLVSRNSVLIGLTAGAALSILVVIAFFSLIILGAPKRVASGVSVAGVPIGGLTTASATDRVRSDLPPQQIVLRDGARQWAISPAEIGVGIDLDATIAQAADAPSASTLSPVYTVDLALAQNGLLSLAPRIEIVAQPGVNGRLLDIPVMLDRLRLDVNGEIADSAFDLDMIDIPAPVPQLSHVVEPGQELALIARRYGVSIDEILGYNAISDPDMIYPGQTLIIPAAGEFVPVNPPAPSTNSGRAIVISTGDQRIYAYENGQLVRTHLVSTGRMVTPTVLGDYAVYVKYRATDMSGPGYFLPQVPFTMYFHQGYGIHGTYWHNSFGRTMSHGCVNLPTPEAEWFFNFASVGTPVRVI